MMQMCILIVDSLKRCLPSFSEFSTSKVRVHVEIEA